MVQRAAIRLHGSLFSKQNLWKYIAHLLRLYNDKPLYLRKALENQIEREVTQCLFT